MKGIKMKNIKFMILTVAVLYFVSFAGVDQNPISTGNTQTRNAYGNSYEAVFHNPAILGIDKTPRGGMFLPLLNLGAGIWSDKLALRPSKDYWADDLEEGSKAFSKLLRRSFDLEGLNEDQVSDKLTDEFKDGFKVYTGARVSLLNGAWGRFGFDVTTHFDEEVHIPEGPLFMIFGNNKNKKGLLEGNTLDFSDFRQEAVWATDFTFHIGLPVQVPALHKLFRLQYGAGGLGIKYVMGHSIIRAITEDGTLSYTNNNEIETNAKLKVQTAGFGFRGPWKNDGMFEDGLPVSGHGIGIDLGGILYDKHGSLTINVQDLGVLFWTSNTRDVTYSINKKDLDAYDIIKGIDDYGDDWDSLQLHIFNHAEGEYISGRNDSLKKADAFVTMLPVKLNIGYTRLWDNEKNSKPFVHWIANDASLSANYEQDLSRGPGRSFIPRLSLGGQTGTMKSVLPLRAGFIFGGAERFGSALGFGINTKYFSFNASYKAVGNLLFVPSKGMEVAAGVNIAWGMRMDTDKDGIDDKTDNCPEIPEDFDSFEDVDGCPDPDNDKDKVADTVDNCINVPEDIDSFEDADGCPDFDNDKDAIADSVDKCPNDPEDRDNFEDEDGCPDPDNDKDNVPDSVDKCPIVPEDTDSFEDADGCPDFDNDKDGLADTVDQCRDVPETFNGYKDDDGCPDTLIKPTQKETVILNTKLRAINFKTGSAILMASSYIALDFIAEFLKQYPHLRYEIQGHTDDQGSDNYNLILSAARAGTVRDYIVSKNVPESRVIAIGYGETSPVADNKDAAGRALNRRVEFRIIETNDDFNSLKVKEADFIQKIHEAKIKGAR